MSSTRADVHDVIVAGSGPAGLLAATLLSGQGVRVALFGPAGANAEDTRTTALFMSAIRLLERCDVWNAIQDHAAPLHTMRIVDRIGRSDHPSVIEFHASELGPGPFGFNIANRVLVEALQDRLDQSAGVTWIESLVEGYRHGDRTVTATAKDGRSATAPLVIAADGRGSPARHAAGLAASVIDYNQTALTAVIEHERPHGGVSTEVHRPGGPFTTVPMPGNRSAIVWLERADEARVIAELDDRGFADRLAEELDGLLGDTTLAGGRGVFPIRGLKAGALAGRRTALVGEAAHVVPPIGAQGLNLGIRDVAEIVGLAGDAHASGDDPGSDALLERYRRARSGDVLARRAATDLLNRSLLLDLPLVRGARGLGLALVAGIGPLRRSLMRAGLVPDRDLPRLMRA